MARSNLVKLCLSRVAKCTRKSVATGLPGSMGAGTFSCDPPAEAGADCRGAGGSAWKGTLQIHELWMPCRAAGLQAGGLAAFETAGCAH